MTDIQSNVYLNNLKYSPPVKGENDFNLDAHTSNKMKLDRPKVDAVNILNNLPASNTKYSYKEAENRLKALNNDIYKGTKKEKSEHEFNFKRYFTIFGILALITAAAACFRRSRGGGK